MNILPTGGTIKNALWTVLIVAVIYRVPQAREALTGDRKFLGIF